MAAMPVWEAGYLPDSSHPQQRLHSEWLVESMSYNKRDEI